MAEANDLPPWPDDEWGRWLSPRGLVNGDVWVRPSSAAERHPRIEILSGSRALRFLEDWIFDDAERDFVHRLHTRLCRLSGHLDPESRWEQVTRELRNAFENERIVVHRLRPPDGAPGTVPVHPPGGDRPP